MKKCFLSFIVACLSLTASVMTFQAAAQDNLTESKVRDIVNEAVHGGHQSSPASSLYGPRFEIVRVPDYQYRVFKFDKETGDTWAISNYKSTSVQKIGRLPDPQEEDRPGEIKYQLIVNSWYHIMLLDVRTGKMWESRLPSGKNAVFEDFKEVGAGT